MALRGDIVTTVQQKHLQHTMEKMKLLWKILNQLLHYVLRHRLRKDPLESIDSGDKVQSSYLVKCFKN